VDGREKFTEKSRRVRRAKSAKGNTGSRDEKERRKKIKIRKRIKSWRFTSQGVWGESFSAAK